MAAKPWDLTQHGGAEPTVSHDTARQRWRQSDFFKVNSTAGKKLLNLWPLNAAYIGIARIIQEKVIPQNQAVRL